MRALRRGVGLAVKGAAATADVLRPPPSGVVVLCYHRVGGRTASNVDLPTERFDAQVAELVATGRLVTLDDAAQLLAGDGPIPHPAPVVLTFDDGTADWNEVVLPVLDQHQAPATFYVATDHVEGRRPFPGDAAPVSWAGLAELHASRLATIGSHTHRHTLLDRVDAATAAAELDRSTDLLAERLGVAPRHFAYPKALLGSPAAEAEVRARFTTAALAGSVANGLGHDLHRLARTPVQVTDGMRWFRRKASGGMRLEDLARGIVAGRRYAGATT